MEYVIIAILALACLVLLSMLKKNKEEMVVLNKEKSAAEELIFGYREKTVQLETLLESEKRMLAEKISFYEEAEKRLENSFKAISKDVLEQNSKTFLETAKGEFEKQQIIAKNELSTKETAINSLIEPIKETIAKVSQKMTEIEKEHIDAYSSVKERIVELSNSQRTLTKETNNLVNALKKPHVRGRWGEMQLKRVVEMAGMVEHCDYYQQESVDAGRLRPDMLVRLPGDKTVVIDAKTTLEAYLEALESTNEEDKVMLLDKHARHVKDHIMKLSQKSYWDQFEESPEFVVMFLPGETFFSAALEKDPTLIEFGVEKKVILATPTTLIALLRAVAYGWKQESLAKDAREISILGSTLYDRLRVLTEHFSAIQKGLEKSVDAYNKAVNSFESRVIPSARKFQEYGLNNGKELPDVSPVEKVPRSMPEM